MSPALTTFLFEAANFLVLATILGKLFFQPVRQAISQRRETLARELNQVIEARTQVEKTQRDIDATRSKLQEELQETRARMLDAARSESETVLAAARASGERELQAMRRQAVAVSESLQERLAVAAATAAADAVGRLLVQLGTPDLDAALIAAACRQLRGMPRQALIPVVVETAHPLSIEQRKLLRDSLDAAADNAQFRVRAELGAGIRISTAQGLVDASATGLAKYARQALLANLNGQTGERPTQQEPGDE